MNIKELESMRDKEMTGLFLLGLQIAVIFGLPAVVAAIIGKKISLRMGNNDWSIICLAIAFILSWVIVIFIYRKKSKKIKKIEDEIRRLRKENGNIKNT